MREAMLYEKLEGGKVRCGLCEHRCRIRPGGTGACGVRQNRGGTLVAATYGLACAARPDPIEKKPLFHFQPGSRSFSIATVGCNFKCSFCQNWQISQAGGRGRLPGERLSPEEVVEAARRSGCASIAYTYTEPTVYFEYAHDTGQLARAAGLANVFVTNGMMTSAALQRARPWLDGANVDLKSFRPEFYKRYCKGRLEPVLERIREMRASGIWVEVTTLVIPGANDSEAELSQIAGFLVSVDPALPWHVSRFHPDNRLLDRGPTPRETLAAAHRIGRAAGLQYVYVGNLWGDRAEGTTCPGCGRLVIGRVGFDLTSFDVEDGRCRHCGAAIAGFEMKRFEG